MVSWIKNNIIFFCAIFVAFALYTNAVCVKNYGATGFLLLQEENILNGKGLLVGNPVLNQKRTFYSVDVEWTELSTRYEKITGKIKTKLLLPCSVVEAHYPGKFFSLSKDKKSFISNISRF